MTTEYIIVQAGGKGTRLEHLTKNKPKCLVPINNLPMLFHLFKQFPDKKFIIIGDYHYDVLDKYLKAFAKVKYLLVKATGMHGTIAGVQKALNYVPAHKSFMLIWSDLILSEQFAMPREKGNFIGLSKDFRCRWKYEAQLFEEQPSEEYGVAGLFIFENKSWLADLPQEGEFVKWLQSKNYTFNEIGLHKTKEYGLLSEYNKIPVSKCRPFNCITVQENQLVKEGIDQQGKALAQKEKAWYLYVEQKGYSHIPKVFSYEPFVMEKIDGQNVYEYRNLNNEQKFEILNKIVEALKELHRIEEVEVDYFSIKENYITKTFERLASIRDLIPFANEEYITINGRKCRNVYFYQRQVEERVNDIATTRFELLHGDCTFSNLMLKEGTTPILIDPRGYFGQTKLFGDPKYDWAKLYYSIVGNYDQFNLKRFDLGISTEDVTLTIESNEWEQLEKPFYELVKDEVSEQELKLLHAIIWLSLTTYAWEDYDSICGAFYNGIYYLEEIL